MNGWLSIEGVAEELGLAGRTIYGLINRGELTAYRFGRVLRVKAEDVDVFLDAARVKPGDLEHLIPVYDGPRHITDTGVDLRAVETA